MKMATTNISSRLSSSFDRKRRKRRKVICSRVLLNYLLLSLLFAVTYYVHLLPQYQSHTNDTNALTESRSNPNHPEYKSNYKNIQDNNQPTGNKSFEKADTQNRGNGEEVPSAKSLLNSKPPFKDEDVIKLYPADSESQLLIKSPNTVVTGYFRVRSKHHADNYDKWMRNMLSLQDAMVIFTEPDLVGQIKDLRRHAVNRTIIVPMSLDDLPIGKLFSDSFWKDQLDRDPEKKIHRSYQVFWIWLSKSWCVTQAIRMNVFDSDLFVWSDIGCFRDRKYNSKKLIKHRETVPYHEILQMAHRKPNAPDKELFNDKYKHKHNFYHSGSQFVGYMDTLLTFHEYFLETIDRFLEHNMIIVEDQAILQSVCLSHPDICAYVPSSQVKDNNYFGLRHVLHFGGDYDYWRHHPNNK